MSSYRCQNELTIIIDWIHFMDFLKLSISNLNMVMTICNFISYVQSNKSFKVTSIHLVAYCFKYLTKQKDKTCVNRSLSLRAQID